MGFVETIITTKDIGVFIATGGRNSGVALEEVTPTMEAVISLRNVVNEIHHKIVKKDRRWKLPQKFILEYRVNTGLIAVKAPNRSLFHRFKKFAKAYEFYNRDKPDERCIYVDIKEVAKFTIPKSWQHLTT